ncbi:MAG: ferritin [Phycisphaerae bacterium]|nr:ferritin [Phycisphaerae bacterium]
MVSKKIEDAFNKQINEELFSAYLYLSMSAQFEAMNLGGFARWMQVQAREETEHAMKFFKYLYDRGGQVKLAAIEGPQTEWKDALEMFEDAYKHEQKITGLIHGLADLAEKEKDRASLLFLQWFIDEQVEEEKHADEIVQTLKQIGKASHALYMLDKHLGERKAD